MGRVRQHVTALVVAVALAAAGIALTAPRPARAAGPGPSIAISATPTTLDAPVACFARVAVRLTNTTGHSGFATVDLDVPAPLTVTPTRVTSYYVADYSWTTGIAVTIPPGTEPGSYPLTLTSDRTSVTVPIEVPAGGAHCLAPEELTATASSWHSTVPPTNAVDGDLLTRWGVEYDPYAPGPQSVTIDTGAVQPLSQLRYWPRQDSNSNGVITGYNVYVSTDGTTFTLVDSGTWAFDHTMKSAPLGVRARYVRLEVTEGGRGGEPTVGGYGVAAEIQLVATTA